MFSSIATAALLTATLTTGSAVPDTGAHNVLPEEPVATSIVENGGVVPLAIGLDICAWIGLTC